MGRFDSQRLKGVVLLGIVMFGFILLVLYFGFSLTVIDITVSALLTAALVILYFRQTNILESQLNREARQQHTETLRERVLAWHGNADMHIPDDPINQPSQKLPAVRDASFESAPNGSLFDEDRDTFDVIPSNLKGDRYLQDLLENHAPDLREKKDESLQLNEEFEELREQFCQKLEVGKVHKTGELTIEPTPFLDQWIFELLVTYDRDIYENFDELWDYARIRFDDGGIGNHAHEPRIWIRVDRPMMSDRAVYSALHDPHLDDLREQRSTAKEEAKRLVEQVFEEIESKYPFEETWEAAITLDRASEAIKELNHILVEYAGRPVYPGNCEYLNEARNPGCIRTSQWNPLKD